MAHRHPGDGARAIGRTRLHTRHLHLELPQQLLRQRARVLLGLRDDHLQHCLRYRYPGEEEDDPGSVRDRDLHHTYQAD